MLVSYWTHMNKR